MAEDIKIHKVIYFDENSAGDLLNIADGGIKNTLLEETNSLEILKSIDVNTKISLFASIATFLGIFGMVVSNNQVLTVIAVITSVVGVIATIVPISLNLIYKRTRMGKSLVNTQVKSTVLSEYLKKQTEIDKYEGYFVDIPANSFAFLKFYEWAFKLINLDLQGIDISKFGEVIGDTKGYYELIASKDESGKEVKKIFRLNAQAFRNNYKLTDLLQMNLVYFGIKVGKMPLKRIEFENTLKFDSGAKSAQDAYKNIEGKNDASSEEEEEFDVIDIILAGVQQT